MKALSIKLPEPLFFDLTQRAKSAATRQSEIIRLALSAYLAGGGTGRASRWIGMG